MNAPTLEGHLASIWAKAHAIGCQVVQLAQSAAVEAQSSFGYPQEYYNMIKTERWVEDQGPQSSLASSGQYWDYLVDVGSALHNAWDTAKIATNTGLGPAGADIASSQVATVLFTGKSSQGFKLPLYFAAPREFEQQMGWLECRPRHRQLQHFRSAGRERGYCAKISILTTRTTVSVSAPTAVTYR